MKRVFQHPPESPNEAKRYWRSVNELSDTAEFREWLEHEFPNGASEMHDDEWSRRSFLKLMGASMALAGVGLTSCRRPETQITHMDWKPEWEKPAEFVATYGQPKDAKDDWSKKEKLTQEEIGQTLKERWNIQPTVNCQGCHR